MFNGLREDVAKTLEMIKAGLMKATLDQPTSATTGLQAYNLEAPAKTLVPRWTPLRNSIPRIGGGYAIQANWKAVTDIDSSNTPIGVPEGKRNQAIAITTSDYNAVFKTFSAEASATWQAQWAGKNFEDAVSRARQSGLHKFFVSEEQVILGGNTTSTGIALGTTSTPTIVKSTTGGSISVAAVHVMCIALTHDGFKASSVANGVAIQTTVTPEDGSATYTVNRGKAAISAEASETGMTGSTNKLTITSAAKRGAVAYAWYIGTATGAANLRLYSITTTNVLVLTENPPGTGQLANVAGLSTDYSQDQYVCDGLITQISKSGSNGYWKSLDNATLTADGKGGIVEFNDLLIDRFVNYKVSSYDIILSPKMLDKAGQLMRTGTTSTPFTVNVSAGDGNIRGGGRAISYLHPITGEELRLVAHPDLADGTIIFKLLDLGPLYSDDRIPNVWQMLMRQDYMSVEWPLKTFKYELAVVTDGVLQGYFPAGNGIICNVALS